MASSKNGRRAKFSSSAKVLRPGEKRPKKSEAKAKAKGEGNNGVSVFDLDAGEPASRKKQSSKQRWMAVLVVVFGVVMAISMMLPSLSAIFANGGSTASQEQSQTSDDGGSDDGSSKQYDTSTMDGLDAAFTDVAKPLEDKLASDPQNLAALLNLGNTYMNWGYNASQLAVKNGIPTETDARHVLDIFAKAIGYYDQYLALNDSASVKVNRALCELYSAQSDQAIADLTQTTIDNPDYGPAWANLGLAYEATGDQGKAKEAYEKAKEVDANDEYGAKSFAGKRLVAMQQKQNQETEQTLGIGQTSQGLSDALNGAGSL